MRRLLNPITLFVTATTVALVSTAVSARGPAAPKREPSPKAKPEHQSMQNPPKRESDGSNGSSRRGGSITILNSGYGSKPGRINGLPVLDHPLRNRHKSEPGRIDGLPVLDHPLHDRKHPVSEPGRINGLPIVEHQTVPGAPQGGARNPESGVSTVPFPDHLNGTGASTGSTGTGTFMPFPNHLNGTSAGTGTTGTGTTFEPFPHHLNPPTGTTFEPFPHHLNPPGGSTGPGKTNPPPRHHPNPTCGNGLPVAGVAYFGGSVPVAAAAPAADSTAAATANDAAAGDAANLTNVPAGATIKLDGSDFGAQPGRVTIVAGNMILPTEVVSWTEKSVSLTLPQIEMTAPMHAKFVVHRANGSAAMETPFQLSDRAK